MLHIGHDHVHNGSSQKRGEPLYSVNALSRGRRHGDGRGYPLKLVRVDVRNGLLVPEQIASLQLPGD